MITPSSTLLMQITSAQGPVECCRAVAQAFKRICAEASELGIDVSLLEQIDGPAAQTARSIFLALDIRKQSEAAHLAMQHFVKGWNGTVQWISPSTYRRGHKRKNWFIGVNVYEPPALPPQASEIIFETMRASGPGGQHVNTSATAVQATHTASGISVRVQTQRSQHANKQFAIFLIAKKLQEQQTANQIANKKAQWLNHYQLERGNPVRTFYGEKFSPDA